EVIRHGLISVQRTEVAITAGQCNIPASFWQASQHAQVAYTPRLAIDVHIPYPPAAHPHNLVPLAVFADDHLARHAPRLFSQEERWFARKREGDIAGHSY